MNSFNKFISAFDSFADSSSSSREQKKVKIMHEKKSNHLAQLKCYNLLLSATAKYVR